MINLSADFAVSCLWFFRGKCDQSFAFCPALMKSLIGVLPLGLGLLTTGQLAKCVGVPKTGISRTSKNPQGPFEEPVSSPFHQGVAGCWSPVILALGQDPGSRSLPLVILISSGTEFKLIKALMG